MDEKVIAVVGAAAAVTFMGRGLRPVGKLVMRGVVAAGDATAASKRGIQDLYNEVKAEREQGGSQPDPGTAPKEATAQSTGADAGAE